MGIFKRETQPMKVLIDTNVVIDVALERQPYLLTSEKVLQFSEQGQISGYISASTFSDLYYIIRKQRGKNWTIDFLRRLFSFCQIATVDNSVIEMALNANFDDFEDGIQYSAAICNHLDVIVTRNLQDFRVTLPRLLTPSQLIQELT